MYMKASHDFYTIPYTQSPDITKVHDLLGQPLVNTSGFEQFVYYVQYKEIDHLKQ